MHWKSSSLQKLRFVIQISTGNRELWYFIVFFVLMKLSAFHCYEVNSENRKYHGDKFLLTLLNSCQTNECSDKLWNCHRSSDFIKCFIDSRFTTRNSFKALVALVNSIFFVSLIAQCPIFQKFGLLFLIYW